MWSFSPHLFFLFWALLLLCEVFLQPLPPRAEGRMRRDRRARLDLHSWIKINLYLVVPAFIFHEAAINAEKLWLLGGLPPRIIAFF